QLQCLEYERASHNDCDNKEQAVRVSQTERKSHQRKCREMFKLRAGNHRTGVDRGQRRVNDESECEPASNNGYSLNHRWLISYSFNDLNLFAGVPGSSRSKWQTSLTR